MMCTTGTQYVAINFLAKSQWHESDISQRLGIGLLNMQKLYYFPGNWYAELKHLHPHSHVVLYSQPESMQESWFTCIKLGGFSCIH